MAKENFSNKSLGELENMLVESKKKLFGLRLELAEKQLKDISQLKILKKQIARILTAIKSLNK